MSYPINLVATWMQTYPSPTEACQSLNATLGTRYRLSRLGDWRRGETPLPRHVRDVMLRETLPTLEGIGPRRAQRIYPLIRDPDIGRADNAGE